MHEFDSPLTVDEADWLSENHHFRRKKMAGGSIQALFLTETEMHAAAVALASLRSQRWRAHLDEQRQVS